MATIGFKLAYGNPTVVHVPEHTTSPGFLRGDLVYINTTYGTLAIISDDQTIFGIAGADASGTANTQIPVYVISPEQVYIAQLDTTSAQAQVGNDYGINISTGAFSVDSSDVTTATVTVIDLFDDVGTATGKVLVKFDPARLQTGQTA